MDLKYCDAKLTEAGVKFASGLTENEFTRVEEAFGFRFPPDLREFLAFALPVSDRWVNWRDAPESEIRERLSWPYEGMCFDIEHNDFWMESWGRRPSSQHEAFLVAKRAVAAAPNLIPIYAHRYIPDEPNEAGNPILSVYQTDIIYYGRDLFDYLQNEFVQYFGRDGYQMSGDFKRIEFWSELVE